MTGNKRRVLPLYFGKRDDDLWSVIQSIEPGDRNHQIRLALRVYFLNENIAPFDGVKKSDNSIENKRRVLPLYFGKRDDDLWSVIQSIEPGDRNYETRKALRMYFLSADFEDQYVIEKNDDMDSIMVGLNSDLIK